MRLKTGTQPFACSPPASARSACTGQAAVSLPICGLRRASRCGQQQPAITVSPVLTARPRNTGKTADQPPPIPNGHCVQQAGNTHTSPSPLPTTWMCEPPFFHQAKHPDLKKPDPQTLSKQTSALQPAPLLFYTIWWPYQCRLTLQGASLSAVSFRVPSTICAMMGLRRSPLCPKSGSALACMQRCLSSMTV